MKPRLIATIVLLGVVAASAGVLILRNTAEAPAAKAETPAPEVNETRVYYFHTSQRCPTCRKLEKYTEATLKDHFADELAEGAIVWTVINTDAPENAHYLKDYQLVTKSVVLSRVEDGKETRWKNLDKIWQKVRDEAAYYDYVEAELRAFTGSAG